MISQNFLIQRKHKNALLPEKKNDDEHFYRLFAFGDYIVFPFEDAEISTGICASLPHHTFGIIEPCNSMVDGGSLSGFCKTFSSQDRSEIKLLLRNTSLEPINIHHGDFIGKLTILPFISPITQLVRTLPQ